MEKRILARVRDRTGALERVIGMMRRRAFAVRRLSISVDDEGLLDVAIRAAEPADRARRLCAELRDLVDVVEARPLESDREACTRELLLARLPGSASPATIPEARPIPGPTGSTILEVTGAPEDLDEIVARIQASGVDAQFTRTGEIIAPPTNDTQEHDTSTGEDG